MRSISSIWKYLVHPGKSRDRLWVTGLLLACCTAAHAQIQVLQLKDQSNPGTRSAQGETLENRDAFCVVSVRRNNVRLAFGSAHGNSANGSSWLARNSSGESLPYSQYMEYSDGSGTVEVSTASGNVFVMTGSRTAVAPLLCGTGNAYKRVRSQLAPVNGLRGPYSDNVTVIASPL